MVALLIVYHLRARKKVAAVTQTTPLTIIAPADADLDALLDRLREQLPKGHRVERRNPK